MKLLIVDDHPKRYDRLVAALATLAIPREDIDIIGSTSEARNRMAQDEYDLLVLDIFVPLWPEQEESIQHSMDLLFELGEGEIANPPKYVLGITADPAAAGEALKQFEAWTWTVLHYADTSDEWVIRASNCAKFILDRATSRCAAPQPVDLAIICALAKPEQEEVLKLPWNWGSPRPINDVVFVRDGHVEVGGRRISVCVTTAPRMGMVATALRTASIIAELKPRLVAMTGICAGVRGKVKLGDVLFADPAWDFQSGKRARDKENTQFSMRPHHIGAPSRLRSHVEQLRDDKDLLVRIAGEFPGEPSNISRIFIGPVASGSAVLADGRVIQQIREQHQELIGVEMEIYGLFAAAHAAPAPQPDYLALKGVCDFADPDKEDGHQQYAAFASARVLQALIERFGDRLIPER